MKQITWITLHAAIFCLYTMTMCLSSKNNAITYKLSGRFGDNILQYSRAKWLSFKYNIPLLYKPFKHSDKLAMHHLEKTTYTPEIEKQFKHIINLKSDFHININTNTAHTLFIKGNIQQSTKIPYNIILLYEYMIQHPQFGEELKKMLQPTIPLSTINLPADQVAVAVHVRKGSGSDKPLISPQEYSNHEHLITYQEQLMEKGYFFADQNWPTKFPPEQYYIDQIKKLSSLLNDVPLFVYIFTDDQNPQEIAERFKKAIKKPNITFAYKENNTFNYRDHVIEDYYNMAQFDCLIRSSSHFAFAAQLLGNHKIIIYPQHAQWIGDKIVVDKIGIILREPYINKVKYFSLDKIPLKYKKKLATYINVKNLYLKSNNFLPFPQQRH